MDGLIVVGTALETQLAKAIVLGTLKNDKTPVVEVNIEPCTRYGYTL